MTLMFGDNVPQVQMQMTADSYRIKFF